MLFVGANLQKTLHAYLKPGYRMAGGLTGLILGGGLGAGMAAMMKGGFRRRTTLGKIQAQGGQLDAEDDEDDLQVAW